MKKLAISIVVSFCAIVVLYVWMYVAVISLMEEHAHPDVVDGYVSVIVTSIVVLGLVYWVTETGFRNKPVYSSITIASVLGGVLGTMVTGNIDFGIVGNFVGWTLMLYRQK